MNATSQRAKEACELCRKSRKKCEFDGHSGCRRCLRRRTQCSLILPAEAEVATAAHQGTLAAMESASAPWGGTHYNPVPQDLPCPTPSQETSYWGYLAPALGQYPTDVIIQTSLGNEDQSEQPAMAQEGVFDQNVFNDHGSA